MSTIKINWGYKIIGLYLGFVAIIAVLVVSSFKQNFDLVSEDYYQQELAYQNVLDAGKNQKALSEAANVYANENLLSIQFPRQFEDKILTGNVHLYSPVNARWDKTVPINTRENRVTIPRAQLQKTRYTVKISWSSENKNYYQESEINLYR